MNSNNYLNVTAKIKRLRLSIAELGDSIGDCLLERAKLRAGAVDYRTGNSSDADSLDGLLCEYADNIIKLTDAMHQWESAEHEFLRIIRDSRLTAQETTVIVMRYLYQKSDTQIREETGYRDTSLIIANALKKLNALQKGKDTWKENF